MAAVIDSLVESDYPANNPGMIGLSLWDLLLNHGTKNDAQITFLLYACISY